MVHTPAASAFTLAAPGNITTAVGDGGNSSPVGVLPYGLSFSGANLLVSSLITDKVFRVAPGGGVSTLAGGGGPLPIGDGGPALQAVLSSPRGVATDGTGSVFLTEGYRVRKVDRSGTITTVAGNGTYGSTGDGGPATSAQISPGDMVAGGSGDLFIVDVHYGNSLIRKVDSTGTISTYAGGGSPADGVGDGQVATAAKLSYPSALALDSTGDLFIADGARVRRVDHATGVITTVAGNGTYGTTATNTQATSTPVSASGVAVDGSGRLFISDGSSEVYKVDTSGVITAFASVPGAGSVRLDPAGHLYADSTGGNVIYRVTPGGAVTTYAGSALTSYEQTSWSYAGDGGPATAGKFYSPHGLGVDSAGDVYVADSGHNRVRKVDPSGVVSSVAGGGVGDGLAATAATLTDPHGVVSDSGGNMLIADCGDSRVRTVDASGKISTFAGGASGAAGKGDNSAATSAVLACPSGLAAPTSGIYAGSVLIADCVANTVRRVDPTGKITTVAGGGSPADGLGDGGAATLAALSCPADVAVAGHGTLLIADRDHNRVRAVNPAGHINTVAGDGAPGYGDDGVPATSSHVAHPTGLAVDPAGNLYIAEYGQARLRQVDTAGMITTAAGDGIPEFGGDGGPAPLGQFDGPTQVALDPSGNLFVTDGYNSSIREITAGSPAPAPSSGCGSVITRNTVLEADLGPCRGDGITIGADNITLDLNGHQILGPGQSDGTHAGIRLTDRHGVQVMGRHLNGGPPGTGNGTVTGFDAGVAIIGGAGNTVSNVNVTNNVGSLYLWDNTADGPEFADGIFIGESSGNHVTGNVLNGNGFYDGVGVLGYGASNNVLDGNQVINTVGDGTDWTIGVGVGMIFNPFLGLSLAGRGTPLTGNQIINNNVSNNNRAGISNMANDNATITGNTVVNNGNNDPYSNPGNGIGIQRGGELAPMSTGDTVSNNRVHGNTDVGLNIQGRGNSILNNDASYNGYLDLFDGSDWPLEQQCFNTWNGNVWSPDQVYNGVLYPMYEPACTTNGGHVATSPPTGAAPTAGATAAHGKSSTGSGEDVPARGNKNGAHNPAP